MKTLQEYLSASHAPEDLGRIITLIADQAGPIRSAFISNQNYAGSTNSSYEDLAEMDTWSDDRITSVLQEIGLVRALSSEEREDIVEMSPSAKYSVVMDPLDGSSLIKVNLTVGTIVGIYEGEVLQAGNKLRAAFYMLYGPMTTLTISLGDGVSVFAQNAEGTYVLLKENVRILEGTLCGSGGLRPEWTDKHVQYMNEIECEGGKNRYSGSFVADFQQILEYGGVYAYPATKKSASGKLRLVFEINPIGFLAVQAGGAVSNGESSTLDIVPKMVHQRTPVYVGSKGMIAKIEAIR